MDYSDIDSIMFALRTKLKETIKGLRIRNELRKVWPRKIP